MCIGARELRTCCYVHVQFLCALVLEAIFIYIYIISCFQLNCGNMLEV